MNVAVNFRKQYGAFFAAAALFLAAALTVAAPVKEARPSAGPALMDLPDVNLERANSSSELASVIAARPLFSASRRPTSTAGAEEDGIGDYRLAGVFIDKSTRKAFFVPNSGATGKWVAAGERVGGWRVIALGKGRVELSRGAETRTLTIGHAPTLTPEQISQARAATPIYLSAGSVESPNEIEARRKALNALFAQENENGDDQ